LKPQGFDLVLIPVRPQIFDLETLSAVRDALRIAGSPHAYVLLNGIHPSATRSPVEQRDVIGNAFGLPVCSVHLSHRAAFAEAPATGQAPQEFEPNGKAAAELEACLWTKRHSLTCVSRTFRRPVNEQSGHIASSLEPEQRQEQSGRTTPD
jgi:hypothetical protein